MDENFFQRYYSFNNKKQPSSLNHQPQLLSQEHQLDLFQPECNSKFLSDYQLELGGNQLERISQSLPLHSQTNLFSPESNSQFSSGYQSELSSNQSEQLSPRSFLHDNQTNLFSPESLLLDNQTNIFSPESLLLDNQTNIFSPESLLLDNQTNLFSFENDSQLPPCYQSELSDNQFEDKQHLFPFDNQSNLNLYKCNSQYSLTNQLEVQQFSSHLIQQEENIKQFPFENETNLYNSQYSFNNQLEEQQFSSHLIQKEENIQQFPFDNETNLLTPTYNSQYSFNNQLEEQQFSSHLIQKEKNIQQFPFDNETNLFSPTYNSQPCFSYDFDDSFLFESLISEDKSQLSENYPILPSPENKSPVHQSTNTNSSGYNPESAHIPSKSFSSVYESQVHSTNNGSKSEVSHSEILYNKDPFKSYDEPHPVSSIEDQNINKFEKFIKNSDVLCYDKDDIPTYLESNNNIKKILNIEKYLKLIKKTKPLLCFDILTIQMLEEMTEKFVETVMNGACQFAKHRKGNTVIVEDIRLYLENVLNTKAPPGFFDFEIYKYKKPVVTEGHKARLALIKKTMKKNGKNSS